MPGSSAPSSTNGCSFAIPITPIVAKEVSSPIARPRRRAGNSSPITITASAYSACKKKRASVWSAVNSKGERASAVSPVAAPKPSTVTNSSSRRPKRSAKSSRKKEATMPTRVML